MKKILLLLLFASTGVLAQHTTTDKVVVIFDEEGSDAISLNSTSEECYFTVRLEGLENRIYNGYQMDVHLPDGMTVLTDDEDKLVIEMAKGDWTSDGVDLYPYTGKRDKTYMHSVSGNMIGYNTLRVGCLSQTSDNFKATTGDLFQVFVKTSSYMKPGDIKITIDNVVLNANEETQGDGVMHAVSYKPSVECGGTISGVSGACTMPFNVSGANHWSTCILPFATEIPSGVKAYTSSEHDAESIILHQAESLEAYTPYILYSESGYSGTVSGTVDANNYPESGIVTVGNLTGAIVPQTVTEGFIMQKHDNKVQFYAIAAGDQFLVPAGKCWMNIASDNTKAFNFLIEEDETAIRSLTADSSTWRGEIYNLAGQRMSQMQKGINIVDGKKFILTK